MSSPFLEFFSTVQYKRLDRGHQTVEVGSVVNAMGRVVIDRKNRLKGKEIDISLCLRRKI